MLLKKNTSCHLILIGDGKEKDKLKILAKEILPDNSYSFYPSQSTDGIRKIMNSSDIFVLPSNGYEGWGAVVNEAMSESCTVIASVESGSGKSIIRDNENGILFNSGDSNMLSKKISLLVNDEKLRKEIAMKGQKVIKEIWSPEVAANRLVRVCNALIKKESIPYYREGPLKNNFKL